MITAETPPRNRQTEVHRLAEAVIGGRKTYEAARRCLLSVTDDGNLGQAELQADRMLLAALADLEQRRAETIAAMHLAADRAIAAGAPRAGVITAMLQVAMRSEDRLPPEPIRKTIADAERDQRWRTRWNEVRTLSL